MTIEKLEQSNALKESIDSLTGTIERAKEGTPALYIDNGRHKTFRNVVESEMKAYINHDEIKIISEMAGGMIIKLLEDKLAVLQSEFDNL